MTTDKIAALEASINAASHALEENWQSVWIDYAHLENLRDTARAHLEQLKAGE